MIARPVSLQLGSPIAAVGFGIMGDFPVVTMPEAAVDKDDFTAWPENQVRLAGQILAMQPEAEAESFGVQKGCTMFMAVIETGYTMKATLLIERLARIVRQHGDVNVEIETDFEIVTAREIRYEETDAERGHTIIIQGHM